jgi:hypothetical protein
VLESLFGREPDEEEKGREIRFRFCVHSMNRRHEPQQECYAPHTALALRSVAATSYLWALSHRKQPSKNDRKGASVQRSAVDKSRDPGLRFFPLELATILGCSDESKNIFARLLLSIKWRGGTPMTSMMQASCSTSFSPGNRG